MYETRNETAQSCPLAVRVCCTRPGHARCFAKRARKLVSSYRSSAKTISRLLCLPKVTPRWAACWRRASAASAQVSIEAWSVQTLPTIASPVWRLVMFRTAQKPGLAFICGSTSPRKKSRCSSSIAGSMLRRRSSSEQPTFGGWAVSTSSSSKCSTLISPPTTRLPSSRALTRVLPLASRSASVSHSDSTPITPPERSALAVTPRKPFCSASSGAIVSLRYLIPASMSVAPVKVTIRANIVVPSPVRVSHAGRVPPTSLTAGRLDRNTQLGRGFTTVCDSPSGARPPTAARLEPLDANSWREGRSRSLGQVAAWMAVCRRRSRSAALLYLSAVRRSLRSSGSQTESLIRIPLLRGQVGADRSGLEVECTPELIPRVSGVVPQRNPVAFAVTILPEAANAHDYVDNLLRACRDTGLTVKAAS